MSGATRAALVEAAWLRELRAPGPGGVAARAPGSGPEAPDPADQRAEGHGTPGPAVL